MIEARAEIEVPILKPLKYADENLRDTILKAADATAKWHARYMLRHHVRNQLEPWFRDREARIARDVTAYTRRFRGRYLDGNTVSDAFGGKRRDLFSLEHGGTYEQWVKPYTRRRALRTGAARGQGARKSGRIEVRGHRRYQKQKAIAMFARTLGDLRGQVNEPMRRAVQILMNEKRVPTQQELLRGLPR